METDCVAVIVPSWLFIHNQISDTADNPASAEEDDRDGVALRRTRSIHRRTHVRPVPSGRRLGGSEVSLWGETGRAVKMGSMSSIIYRKKIDSQTKKRKQHIQKSCVCVLLSRRLSWRWWKIKSPLLHQRNTKRPQRPSSNAPRQFSFNATHLQSTQDLREKIFFGFHQQNNEGVRSTLDHTTSRCQTSRQTRQETSVYSHSKDSGFYCSRYHLKLRSNKKEKNQFLSVFRFHTNDKRSQDGIDWGEVGPSEGKYRSGSAHLHIVKRKKKNRREGWVGRQCDWHRHPQLLSRSVQPRVRSTQDSLFPLFPLSLNLSRSHSTPMSGPRRRHVAYNYWLAIEQKGGRAGGQSSRCVGCLVGWCWLAAFAERRKLS